MTTLGLGATVGLVAGIMFWVAKTPTAQAQQQDERVLIHIEVTRIGAAQGQSQAVFLKDNLKSAQVKDSAGHALSRRTAKDASLR